MQKTRTENILSEVAAEEFVGREQDLRALIEFAHGTDETTNSLLLLASPGAGATEFLLQSYDYFFRRKSSIVPFYFQFKTDESDARQCARRFAQEFVRQFFAFRRQNASLLTAGIGEILESAQPEGKSQLTRLFDETTPSNFLIDEREELKKYLSLPQRLMDDGEKILLLIDDVQETDSSIGRTKLLDELARIYRRENAKIVFSGRRRFVLKRFQNVTSVQQKFLRLDFLKEADAKRLIEKWSDKHGVKIGETATDLIVNQFAGNSVFIESLIQRAARLGSHLDNFQAVQQIYVEELFGGNIGARLDAEIERAAGALPSRSKRIARLLYKMLSDERQISRNELWRRFLKVSEAELERILKVLHVAELINYSAGKIRLSGDHTVTNNYLRARHLLENSAQPRALVLKNILAGALKQAPQLMYKNYRRKAASNLREFLAAFNCQRVSAMLLDYQNFRENLKGAEQATVSEKLKSDRNQILLPQMVFSASGASVYPPLAKVIEDERCAVALGFQSGEYLAENEIVWLAAEIDSKLEASAELAEFWCDRLEMVAVMCGFQKYQLWLVSPNGFSPEASEVLDQRGAYSSNGEQLKYLAKSVKIETVNASKLKRNEYEMILPMGDDTEMIAARAVEELARRHEFEPKAIAQIKTALVEACINAAEHSLSPDRKIYQKFAVENNKLIITVANRGLKIPAQKIAAAAASIEPNEGRRGWGLKLMRSLMDEVEFESTDDGAKISMVKYRITDS